MSTAQGQPSALSRLLPEQSSILNLLTSQQSQFQRGIRLTFSQELQDKIAFDKTPYHYCAVSGNVDLAALLYSIGTPFDEDIHIAKFAADGSQSTTPWKKILAVSPVDTARMAGHAQAAEVLEQIQAGIPLHWNRALHHLYPGAFRIHARTLIESIASSSAFARLPGAARVLIVNQIMTMLAQELVWPAFSAAVWKNQWESCVGFTSQEAQQLLEGNRPDANPTGAQLTATNHAALAAYQFTIRDNLPRRRGSVQAVLLSTAVSIAAGLHQHGAVQRIRRPDSLHVEIEQFDDAGLLASEAAGNWGFGHMAMAGAYCIGYLRPTTTTVFVTLAEIAQRRGRRR